MPKYKKLKHGEQKRASDLTGIAYNTIKQWHHTGKLDPFVRRGGVLDIEAFKSGVNEMVNPDYQARANARWKPEPSEQESQEQPTEDNQPESKPKSTSRMTIAEAQRVKLSYEAAIKKHEYETRIGQYIEKAKAIDETFTAFRLLRDQILAIPDRETDILMSIRNKSEFRKKLTDILSKPLVEVQKYKLIKAAK